MLALMLSSCAATVSNDCDCIENASMREAKQFFGGIPMSIETAQAKMPGNELEPAEEGRDAKFYCNPLLLNGKTLNLSEFSIFSKGILSVAEGEPESPGAKKIPFLIYLRRDGVILGQGKNSPEVTKIELSEILMFAQPNDQLIIEPVQKKDWKAKRVITLTDGC